MGKLNFVFTDEFVAALRKDWKTRTTVEDAIENFLNDDDVEEIRVSDGKGFYRRNDVNVLFIFDTKNDDLILEIYDEVTLQPILMLIGHDEKIMFEKRGNVAYVIY